MKFVIHRFFLILAFSEYRLFCYVFLLIDIMHIKIKHIRPWAMVEARHNRPSSKNGILIYRWGFAVQEKKPSNGKKNALQL